MISGHWSGAPGSVLDGGAGPDSAFDDDPSSHLVGGPGADRIRAGGGDDTVDARDGERDEVECGGSSDGVVADELDAVSADCESVERA